MLVVFIFSSLLAKIKKNFTDMTNVNWLMSIKRVVILIIITIYCGPILLTLLIKLSKQIHR